MIAYRVLLILPAIFSVYSCLAQSYRLSNDIVVKNLSGKSLKYAWAGGINNAHIGGLDLDRDGRQDLIVYDDNSRIFTPYLNQGGPGQVAYSFAPEYKANFDSCECKNWAVIEDYNCDGLPDIFCGGGSVGQHFKVYEQVVYQGDSVGFELKYDPVTEQSFNIIPVFTLSIDVPAIVDVDFDGDIDIISSQNGFDYFAFHKNMSMERYGRCDTLDFDYATGCWGHFSEGSIDNTLFVSDTINCSRSGGGVDPIQSRHVGSTLLVLDLNADSLMDVLLGDVSYSTVNAAINHGTRAHAFMDTAIYIYPTNDSAIDVELFPALFYVDVDNDSVKDLLISPNSLTGGENLNNVVWYNNQGSNNSPQFHFVERGLLGDQIDAGNYSTPLFFDYNADQKMDLLIGARVAISKEPDTILFKYQLQLYENTGNLSKPAFRLVDDDYLDGSLGFLLFDSATPTSGDLDGDGDQDLLIGNSSGTLYYYRNDASPGSTAQFVQVTTGLKDHNGVVIDVGSLSAPDLFDIDDDMDLDLFIGERFGKIRFYENTGSVTNPQFTLVSEQWGGINIRTRETGFEFYGRTKPLFVDYDQDNITELLLGTEDGVVEIYEDLSNALTDTIEKSGELFDFYFGREAAPTAAVIDTSGKYTFIVGNERGGLMLFHTLVSDTVMTAISDLHLRRPFKLFPNPTSGQLKVEFEANLIGEKQLAVYNAMGQLLMRTSTRSEAYLLNITHLPPAIYHVHVSLGGQMWSVKVVRSP